MILLKENRKHIGITSKFIVKLLRDLLKFVKNIIHSI